ncbi:MAG: RNase adapter RapZ [Actinomycetota bacterium]|nr:RNase adapter RapZ [Actinomycetota bacterium]
MVEYLIITGLSGAGRSQAGATLEDLGWFVIDNMPTELITKVAELTSRPGSTTGRVALVVGRDATQLEQLQAAVTQLRLDGVRVRVLYLEASDEVLVQRFEGTRRRHPVERDGVIDAIDIERHRLRPVREMADLVVDTSDTNVHQLRERLVEMFSDSTSQTMRLRVLSFGFKYGVPRDVDSILDVRFLPNPYWIEPLRPFTGLDQPVRDWVLGHPAAVEFLDRVDDLFGFLLPAYAGEAKAYLTIALGCTGGRHRSVVLANALAGRVRERGYEPAIHHRDIDR